MAIKFDKILGELRESDAGAGYTLPTATDLVKGGVKIGARLTMTGEVLSADVQTTDISGKVDKNADIVAGTKTKITYDAKGLVTVGADATTADIADSTNKRYVTDANLTVIGNTSGTNTGDNATNTQYSGLATSKQDALSGTGFVKIAGTTISYDNSTYLTSLSGAVLVSQATPQTIGDTTNRLLKLWATDITVTNAITGSVTGNAGTVTTNANLTGVITSVGNATSIASQTGTGTKFVVDTSPSFTTKITTPHLAIGSATGANSASYGSDSVSGNPGTRLEVTRPASGGVAVPFFNALITNTGSSVSTQVGTIGVYGNTQVTTPTSAYIYMDASSTGAYNNAAFKLTDTGEVGIGLTSTTEPSQKLHVVGNGYFTGALGVGTAPVTTADIRINSTAVNESSLYVGLWQSVSYNPVGTPVAGTNVRGLLFQVSTPATADNLSNVILYGALGQVTHGGSGALGQAIGMNPGIFLTGSGNVTTSAGITLSATASGGGAHTTWTGFRSGGITLSGGSTMVNSYAFYADAVTGATNNYSWLSNAGLFVVNETGDASSDLRVEGDTNTHLLITDASADCVGINVTAPAGKLDIQQTSTTATIPTLILDQSDLSEEFIQFETTVDTDNPLDTGALGTYYCKARVSVNGTFKFIALYNV